MWKRSVSFALKCGVDDPRKVRLAAGVALSLVVMAKLDSQHKKQEEQTQSETHQDASRLPTSEPSRSSFLDKLPPLVSSSSCEQDSYLVGHVRHISRLARHQTIRKIENTSTRSSVDSRYSVRWTKPLGEGAFGSVYLATDRKTGETVALKKISKTQTDDVAFQREMNALLHLRKTGGHPNICGLREHFDEGDYYYLILDLVSGGEMFDHLVRQGPYSEADAARLVREVASALAFLHGIDCVHGDLKPENLMLSTENPSDAVVKLVDFGCAQVTAEDSAFPESPVRDKKGGKDAFTGNTPAYCPPEILDKRRKCKTIDTSMDMWALGIILYIMLTGLHPFDLSGNASDSEIERRIVTKQAPPLKNSPITAHLSASAIDLIQKLMAWNPKKRISALEMLEHPWVRGETARRNKMADSDKKLSMYRVFKSRLEAQVFADIVAWSDKTDIDDVSKRTSLIERSFRSFDPQHKGYITTKDLRKLSENGKDSTGEQDDSDSTPLSLSGFSDLLSENMKNKYFPKGHVIYREGDTGNHMYFINSGTIEVSTKDGSCVQRKQGDFFGEGALLHPKKIRSATIKCVTPVHAIEISRVYFEKYLASSELGLTLNLREKDKTRKRNRAKTILRLQNNIYSRTVKEGEYLFKVGEEGKELFILEEGMVDVQISDHTVFMLKPGDMFGEHSLIFGRPRNTSALCVADECSVHVMRARDFYAFLDSAPNVKESLHDICLRREFQKALVFKTKKPFPTDPKGLREAFDAADVDSKGKLSLDNIRSMLMFMDPSISEDEVQAILKSLDLDETGVVSFDEFKRIFGIDECQASSI